MGKIPTSKEIFSKYSKEANRIQEIRFNEMLIEFAKLHVEAALKEASKEATINKNKGEVTARTFGNVINGTYSINQQSILNSYPPENIK